MVEILTGIYAFIAAAFFTMLIYWNIIDGVYKHSDIKEGIIIFLSLISAIFWPIVTCVIGALFVIEILFDYPEHD